MQGLALARRLPERCGFDEGGLGIFLVLLLGAVVAWQGVRLSALNRRVGELERRLGARAAEPLWTPPTPVAAAPEPAPTPAPPAYQAEEELVLDQPLPLDDREPLLLDTPIASDELLLDTPLPEPSNDTEPLPAPPAPPQRAEPERIAQALRKSAYPPPEFRFEQWLAEKGLAWLGGGAAALGAIFLVSVAAQQRWFTPQVQLALALALGAILLGASEWARRVSLSRPPGHPLIAALLAGAGVVAFYATAWAAHGLYNFIDFPTAAALLALCALALIGLSFLHGQAIGILAVVAALLTPALTHEPLWLSAALTFYVIAAGSAGFALATFRRWSWVALVTLAGLYFWFWAAFDVDEIQRALALLSFASFGCATLALRPPLPDESRAALSWSNVHALGPTIGIAVSSMFLVFIWPAFAPPMSGRVAGPALIGVYHLALAAYCVRSRVAWPHGLIAAILGLVGGCVAYLVTRSNLLGPVGADFYAVILAAALAIVICAVGARPHRRWRVATAATGALGAALLVMLTSFTRDDQQALDAWAPLFIGALPLFAAAWHAARDGAAATTDRVIDFWAGAGAALVLLGVEYAFPSDSRTAAHAGAALMFASAFAWRGWRVLRYASLVAAVVTIGHALSPNLIGATLTGDIPLWGALVVLAAAAALLSGAAYFAAAEPRSPYAEALSAASVMTILIGVFLALRWFAAGAGAPLDAFSESALRVVALMAAGHVMMARPGQALGFIGRWRGHVLLGVGLLYSLLVPLLGINPWWGAPPAPVSGPPLLDTLTLAFAAPAAIAMAAARRLYLHQRTLARIYAIAGGLLGLVWAVLEVRRFTHGAEMSAAPVGLLEGAAYALLFLGAAVGVAIFARLRAAKHADGPFTQDLLRAMRAVAWVGLIAAGFILLIARHPWWGAQSAAATDAQQTGLAVLAQAVAVGLSLALGRALSLARHAEPTRFAAASMALVFAWSFGHAGFRWLYHQGAMDDGASFIGLEGFANALWPLLFVIAGAELTSRAPGRDTVRAYLHDLAALWSAAVWPALGFAALGLWALWNPWWGANPAPITNPASAAAALLSLLIAAWLSMAAPRVPHVRWPVLFERAATVACIIHLFVAATLAARWFYHREAMSDAPLRDVELWSYSATWALFGAAAFWLGLSRNNETVRWSGLVILLLTTLYVYLLIFTQLTGFIRALTAIGLAVVLFAVAWIARTYRPGPKPGDLVNITPAARRERRYGRRQRSQ
jgi:uncharacterized membrane protein